MIKLQKRIIDDFSLEWKFIKRDEKNAKYPDYDDTVWQKVNLPHDWSIEGPFREDSPSTCRNGYLPGGVGWYRKSFILPEEYKGKNIRIEFDGIHMNSDVWINGHHLGYYPYGYTSICYDITPFLYFNGKSNVVAVRVDNSLQPACRWYTGAGIYRDVRLVVTNHIRVARWGTYVTTPEVTKEYARVNVKTEVENLGDKELPCIVISKIYNKNGQMVGESRTEIDTYAHKTVEVEQSIRVNNPMLWSCETPVMYTLYTQILSGNEILDDYITPFGIRTVEYDPDKGIILNGRQIKLKGVCLHHDNGCLGAAAYYRAEERKLEIMKSMGCNAIRTSHNPPSPQFLDLCDRMGFLVMDEAFDEWRIGKCPFIFSKDGKKRRIIIHGYAKYFDEWHEKDLRAMVRRDRNHPSVIMWSIGNEIREQIDKVLDGNIISERLKSIVREEDPTRPVTCACSQTENANETGFAETLDIVGYNYRERLYEEDHRKYPKRLIVGSETRSHTPFWRRGDYNLELITKDDRIKEAEYSMKKSMGLEYVQGLFIWTGFDYLGEPPFPWPSRSSYFGVVDTCGFPKDSFYFYKAYWQDEPVLHILPHWNLKGYEGKKVPVFAYTNCDYVELFLNGKPLGRKDFRFIDELHLTWEVEYEPGELAAYGYKNHKKVCEKVIRTTDIPAKVVLEADRTKIKADQKDLSFVTARIEDKNGLIVPDACVPVTFKVSGKGTLVGVDNGDPTFVGNLKGNVIPSLNGLCLAVVKSMSEEGIITVKAETPGLEGSEITITVLNNCD